MTTRLLEIDGSQGEGGGQILRTALGLAQLTGQPVRITRIRAGRRKPGLAPQHRETLRALCRLGGGEATGSEVGSTEVTFTPGEGSRSRLEVSVGTAGSVTLVLQALLVALARSGRRVRLSLEGGTHVAWSPSAHYFEHVLVPLLERMGMEIRCQLVRPGFFPKGDGRLEVAVRAPEALRPLCLDRREWEPQLTAHALATDHLQKARVAQRMVAGARKILPEMASAKEYYESRSAGAAFLLTAAFGNTVLGAAALGERGVRAEEVGRRAAAALEPLLESGCTVDPWASDQLLPFLALARGESVIRVSSLTAHARTQMEIIPRFLPVSFGVEEQAQGIRITCSGSGEPGTEA